MKGSTSSSFKTYLFVYLGLLLLLASTVGADFLPLGPFHEVVAVGIAIAKAVLIALFFMNLRSSGSRTIMLVLVGVLLLMVLMALTLTDYATRFNGLPLTH